MRTLLLALLLTSTASAQVLTVDVGNATPIDEPPVLPVIEEFGDQLLLIDDKGAARRITADTEAANVIFECDDIQRVPVPFTQVGKSILIEQPGKVWVRVTAIDLDQNLFAIKTVVVTVGKPDDSDPDPDDPDDPDPEPDPDVPEDKFGNIGQQIAAWCKGLDTAKNQQVGVLYVKAAEGLESDQTETMVSLTNSLNRSMASLPQQNEVHRKVYADLMANWWGASFGRSDLAEYYRAAAKGWR